MELSKRDLQLIGASLYFSEGTKARDDNRGGRVFAFEFTNKDPRMIRVFMRFLREVINVVEQRVKAQLIIYTDHDKDSLILFWSDVTSIPRNRFNKTICLRRKNVRYKPNPLGTIKIRSRVQN